jgi:hypothetical protein
LTPCRWRNGPAHKRMMHWNHQEDFEVPQGPQSQSVLPGVCLTGQTRNQGEASWSLSRPFGLRYKLKHRLGQSIWEIYQGWCH